MARTDPRPHYGTKRRVRADGYIDVWVPGHPLARRDGYAHEHRVVAWDAGILTDPTLHVHHVNGDRQDNRAENLAALSVVDHAIEHARLAGHVLHVPKVDRPCAGCPSVVTAALRSDARYCTERCRIRHWKRQRRKALAAS